MREASGTVTSLVGSNPSFTMQRVADEMPMYTNEPIDNVIGTVLYCLVDTTVGTWEPGPHSLWVRFEEDPEVPYLGPINVQVIE